MRKFETFEMDDESYALKLEDEVKFLRGIAVDADVKLSHVISTAVLVEQRRQNSNLEELIILICDGQKEIVDVLSLECED